MKFDNVFRNVVIGLLMLWIFGTITGYIPIPGYTKTIRVVILNKHSSSKILDFTCPTSGHWAEGPTTDEDHWWYMCGVTDKDGTFK